MNSPQFSFQEMEELHRLILKEIHQHNGNTPSLESALDKIEVAMMAV